MEKSIEHIWKEGFLKSDALIAPKVINLYNQKSNHLIDKMRRVFRNNLIGIIITAFISLTGFIMAGVPAAGVVAFILLIWLVFHSIKQAKELDQFDNGADSYHYLRALKDLLDKKISSYAKTYRILYPLIISTYYLGVLFVEPVFNHITKDAYMLYGLPIYWIGGILIVAGLFSLFAVPLFKYDIKLLYGCIFRKLDEILKDMEELKR